MTTGPLAQFSAVLQYQKHGPNAVSSLFSSKQVNYDKLHKVHPVVEAVQKNCFFLNFIPNHNNAIDEAITYKGRSSLKQMKSIKRGYKVWCCCDCLTGYMCDFNIYTGKDEHTGRGKGLGTKLVTLAELLKGSGHSFIHFPFRRFNCQ